MATAKKKDEPATAGKPSKIIDVSKPDETPADATARPLIVGHGSMIKKDPMVVDTEKDIEKPEEPLSQKASIKIEPPAEAEEPDSPAQTSDEKVSADKEENTDTPEIPEEPPAEEENTETSPEETPSTPEAEDDDTGSGAVSALANEVGNKREAEKAEADNKARIEGVEKLIRSKKYYVPIGELHGHHIVRDLIVLFILLLILAAIGVNFAIDAGKIDIGIKPLTDLL